MGTTFRQQAGDAGEVAAVAYLEKLGYRVLARNFKCRHGEVDVVAEDGEILCFVEVRTRASLTWGDPALTVMRKKQRRVVLAAMYYLQAFTRVPRMCRFDVISVVGRSAPYRLEHLPNAFDAGM